MFLNYIYKFLRFSLYTKFVIVSISGSIGALSLYVILVSLQIQHVRYIIILKKFDVHK